MRCQVIELNFVPQCLVIANQVNEFFPDSKLFFTTMQELLEGWLVKSALGSLLEKVR